MNHICNLISRNVGILNKLKYIFPSYILYTVYKALILPHISYGILAWGKATDSCLNRILVLQKRSLRIIEHADPRAHADPLFFAQKILKVKDIYLLQLGIFMYQYYSNGLPNSFQSMFTTNRQIHSYDTRQSSKVHIPYCRTSQAQKFISYQGPIFWNSLSTGLRNLQSRALFKKKLKSILLDAYSYS